MSTAAPVQTQAAKSPSVSHSTRAGLVLQRKCACGGSAGLTGECEDCRNDKLLGANGARLHRKLTIGASNDPLELEADRIADQVLATPAHSSVSGTPPRIQRYAGQTTEGTDTAPASVDRVLASSGKPLDPALQQDMEQRFGHDFSKVRVHSGGAAEQSTRDVNAHAYTVGRDIVFGAGGFAPGTQAGRRLIVHELTHVVQQSGADGLRAGQTNKKCNLSQSADYSIARQPRTGATGAPPLAVKMMPRDEARVVLAAYIETGGMDDVFAAMNAIRETLEMPFTLKNAGTRRRLLTAAFSLLDASGAASVLKALTKPIGRTQEHLRKRFLRLDSDFRAPLLDILRERAPTKPEAEQADRPAQAAPFTAKATWVELHPGVFAYVPDTRTTLDAVAAYVSTHPDLPDALAQLNDGSRTTPVVQGQSVIIPIEFINREKAFRHMPEPMRLRIVSIRETRAQDKGYLRFVEVKGGVRGPKAYGLFPLSTAPLQEVVSGLLSLIKKAAYAIAFAAGVVHGFLKSIWDAVSGIAKLIYEVLKSIFSLELVSDLGKLVGSLKNLSLDRIKQMLGNWAADWAEKLHSRNPLIAGHAHGYLTGYVMAEAAMLLLTGGAAAEAKAAIWASDLGKLVKGSRAFQTLGTAVEEVSKARRAGAGEFDKAVDALRKSRFRGVVKAAEATGAMVVWTADKVFQLLKLPGKLAQDVAKKLFANAMELGGFFERIGELSEVAQRWLFGCRSPCKWEADAVKKTMTELSTNKQIEDAAELATASVTKRSMVKPRGEPKPPKGRSSTRTAASEKPRTPEEEFADFEKWRTEELGATGPLTSNKLLQMYRHGSRATVAKYLKQYLMKQAAADGVMTVGEMSMKVKPGVALEKQVDAFVKSLEGAHSTPQAFGKMLPKDVQEPLPGGKYNPDDALVVFTEKPTHTVMDQPWKDAFNDWRKAGDKEATAQKVFDAVADGIRKTPGMSDSEKASRIARLHDEMFKELGLVPGRKYDIPRIYNWWEILAFKAKGK